MPEKSIDCEKNLLRILYINSLSHRLKKLRSRYVVNVLFTADNKLYDIRCPADKKGHLNCKKNFTNVM